MTFPTDLFPNRTDFTVTSPKSVKYNCIAWAMEDVLRWWWPDEEGLGHWPAGVAREVTLEAFLAALATAGYTPCDTPDQEPGWEKIALYALADVPTHASRQLPNGRWTSKLGPMQDVEHSLDALDGPLYGRIVRLLERRA